MPVIVFASSKGGTGKTTACVLLAIELARLGKQKGINVTLIDADKNSHSYKWTQKSGCPDNIQPVKADEDSILNDILLAEKEGGFVLVDVEGSRNLAIAKAISRADLVIIPCKPSFMDGQEAAKTVKLVKESEVMTGRSIDLSILFTETNGAIVTKNQKALFEEFALNGIDLLNVSLVKREPYRNIFAFGGTVRDVSASNEKERKSLDNAIKNAEEYTASVFKALENIKRNSTERCASNG
jgi:chromosome partitioning protein